MNFFCSKNGEVLTLRRFILLHFINYPVDNKHSQRADAQKGELIPRIPAHVKAMKEDGKLCEVDEHAEFAEQI